MDGTKRLTVKGVNATEINEGNALLMATLYDDGVFASLNQKQILLVLTCFMEQEEKETTTLSSIQVDDSVKHLLYKGESYCKVIEKTERKHKISFSEWRLNYEFIHILQDLINDVSVGTVCETYGIMEGNLTRFLLKLLNIVDELKNIATLNKDVMLLEKLENVQAYDFYKIAIAESLYLRI